METVRPAADAKGVRLVTIVDPRTAPVSGDPERLQQILWNVLSNAVKFTPRGGRVEVRLERVDSHVEITVSDTGVGIPAEFLPHVFERFRQADAGISRERGGLGLGLAITRHLVELQGGRIFADERRTGKGATFRIELPLRIVAGRWSRSKNASIRRRRGPARRSPCRARRACASWRWTTTAMRWRWSGRFSKRPGRRSPPPIRRSRRSTRWSEMTPDVLLADLGMPQMNGFDLIDRVRRSERPGVREIPAAALTAYARSEDRTKALRRGFQMHLAKPVDPGELMAAMAALAKRPRAAIRLFTNLDIRQATGSTILLPMAMSSGRHTGLPCPECTGDHTERVPLQLDTVTVPVYSCLECGHIWREPEPDPTPPPDTPQRGQRRPS